MGWQDAPVASNEPKWKSAPADPNYKQGIVESYRTDEQMRVGDWPDSLKNQLSGRDVGIDYHTDAGSFGFRMDLSKRDTDEERAAFLNKRVGENNWGQDSHGNYYLTTEGADQIGSKHFGKPVAIDAQRMTINDVADLWGDKLSLLGSIISPSKKYKALANVARVGVATMAGKATQESMEQFQGENLQSFLEVTQDIGSEGAWAAGGEAGVRIFGAAGTKIFGPQAKRMTPKRRRTAKRALDDGFIPWSSQVTDAPLVGKFESMYAHIFGDNRAVHNAGVLHSKIKELRNNAGIGGLRIETGKKLVSKVAAYRNGLSDLIEGTKARITLELKSSMDSLAARIGGVSEDAGAALRADIKDGRREFSVRAKEVYSIVDEMAGQPIVPTSGLRQAAQDQLDLIARTAARTEKGESFVGESGEALFTLKGKVTEGKPVVASSEYVEKLKRITQMEDKIPLAEMQEIRTVFREAAYDDGILGSVSRRHMKLLQNAADESFDLVDDAGKGVIENLRKADDFYKNGIAKYDNITIKALSRADNVSTLDSEGIAALVAQKPGRVRAVKEVIFRNGKTPEADKLWGEVRREYFDEIVDASLDIDGTVDGQKLLRRLTGTNVKQSALREMYGDELPLIQALAKKISAHGGKISPDDLAGSDSTIDMLRNVVKDQATLDDFLSKNFVKELGKEGIEFTNAVNYIFKKDSPQRIAEAKAFFGETSEEWAKIQRESMKEVLLNVIGSSDDVFKTVFDGAKLQKALIGEGGYGVATLKEMFGADQTKQLLRFAKNAKFITRKRSGSSGMLVAASIAIRPLQNLGRLAKIFLLARALQSKTGLELMTNGVLKGTSTRSRAMWMSRFFTQMHLTASDEEGDLLQHLGGSAPEQP